MLRQPAAAPNFTSLRRLLLLFVLSLLGTSGLVSAQRLTEDQYAELG